MPFRRWILHSIVALSLHLGGFGTLVLSNYSKYSTSRQSWFCAAGDKNTGVGMVALLPFNRQIPAAVGALYAGLLEVGGDP